MKKLFLIIGAPGSGKTTDAEIIAERNSDDIIHYSTGDLLRAEVASGSDRGKLINSFISKGLIVPIEIAIETITSAIKSAPSDVILFDGYPRSHEQMNELDKFLLTDSSIELVSVIEVVVSEDVARDRVLGRARGDDDNEKVFNNRMNVYTDPLADIQSFYESKKLLKKIDGERSIDDIVDEMELFIESKI
ncbi:MAG: adenylate kinase [Sulfuricurvum sp.]|uniref:adenylate kinase n=1 Tax=Sulfuricurvum sp. TaxID=2025608 RepID=UPI002639FFBB|nr:adenylate kinase [Sulfuricurvum sp.]MDD5159983.1 adenylate kinase [Sulfuricurvum sp.]